MARAALLLLLLLLRPVPITLPWKRGRHYYYSRYPHYWCCCFDDEDTLDAHVGCLQEMCLSLMLMTTMLLWEEVIADYKSEGRINGVPGPNHTSL
jgi:hypothetical protein